jgi:exosortase
MLSGNTLPADNSSKLRPAGLTYGLAGLLVVTLWSYWTTLAEMAAQWTNDPQYSHGFLVPVFSAALLWMRRQNMAIENWRPSWWGLPVLAIGVTLHLAAAYYYYDWFDGVSLLICLLGTMLFVGGSAALKWSWPAIAFLLFMIPMPYSIEVALRSPLRRIGTVASTFLMQTIGLPALAEGNIIIVGEARIGVDEACSGLRMLVVFFALATAVAIVIKKPLWERLIVVASALVIAIVVNVLRIAATGILHVTVNSEVADFVFHDLAGYLMPLMAMLLLWFELQFLSRLFLVEDHRPVAAGLQIAGIGGANRTDTRNK